MILPVGSFINAGVVAFGAVLGMTLGNRLSDRMRAIVFQGLGLCTLMIGMQMTFKTSNPLYVIGSILIGAVIGEACGVEEGITRVGDGLKRVLKSKDARFTDGFVSATLLMCIGSMAIVGPLQEGITGDMSVVLAKSALDFFAAIAFGAALGLGVACAALPIIVYQGSITLLAGVVGPYISDLLRAELTAVGGVMILGIGFNLLELTKIRLSNFLPALIVVVLLCCIVPWAQRAVL